jgi:hypothetical protein
MKGMALALNVIHDDLVCTLWKDVVAYSTVTKYTCSAQFSSRNEAIPGEVPDVECSPVDEAILTTLAEFPFPFPFRFPFSSVRELSWMIYLPRSTVHRAPCTGAGTDTGTSRNHFASRCDIFDGSQLLTAEGNRTEQNRTKADSGPDGNRTIAGPLGAKHAPVA